MSLPAVIGDDRFAARVASALLADPRGLCEMTGLKPSARPPVPGFLTISLNLNIPQCQHRVYDIAKIELQELHVWACWTWIGGF